MDTGIWGTLICQNAMPDILRCVESVVPYVDEFYIMDGGSTDGTWEWLNKWKDVYNLTLFQHKYDDQGAQRNRLLAKIPKNVWCINIDQDEQLKAPGFREFVSRISPELLKGIGRDLPLTIRFRCINLVDDLYHYDEDNVRHFATKCFYNDRNLHFTPGYHMSICYFETEGNTNAIPTPDDWVIKHYAYLDPVRIKQSSSDPKRHYNQSEWNRNNWKITELKEEWK